MQQIALLVFLAGSLLQLSEAQDPTYGDGICSGTICAQIASSDQIQCIQDPEVTGSPMEVFREKYVESGSGNMITSWGDVAINPLDGTIYVIYQLFGPTDYLGTIEDPLTLPAGGPFEVKPIGGLTTQKYSGITFDCEGNLYGVSWDRPPNVYQFDYNSNTNIETLVDSLTTCTRSQQGFDCIESLFYNFQDEIFYRISSQIAAQDVFFTRNTIDGADIPTDGTDMSGYAGLCGGAVSLMYTAAFYIGNERSIISCPNDNQVYLLSGTPGSPTVTIISNTDLDAGANGLWNYNDNGDICKPPSCTDASTFNPTKTPIDNPSKSPSKAPTICDMSFDGVQCADDSQCPDCMKCCEGKGVCEPYGMSPAKSVVNSVHDIVSHSDNNYKYGYPMYGYILLVGVILFVLINNVFIGYWCACKRDNKELYEKCVDDVEEEL